MSPECSHPERNLVSIILLGILLKTEREGEKKRKGE